MVTICYSMAPSMSGSHYAKLFSVTVNENKGSPVVRSHEAISRTALPIQYNAEASNT